MISADVTYGRVSAAIPGISSRLRRLSVGALGLPRRRLGRGSSPGAPRSIFGARFRTRWPQYGHSVTYGLTSELQFLQTTKRSGSLTYPRIPRRIRAREGPHVDSGRRFLHDLRHHLAQVVVRLVHHDLTRGAVAAVEQVVDALELGRRAQVLGVLAHAVEHAHHEVARAYTRRLGQVDELAVEPVPRGEPLVLVEHLVRVTRQALACLV